MNTKLTSDLRKAVARHIDIYEPMRHILDTEKDRQYAKAVIESFVPKQQTYEHLLENNSRAS